MKRIQGVLRPSNTPFEWLHGVIAELSVSLIAFICLAPIAACGLIAPQEPQAASVPDARYVNTLSRKAIEHEPDAVREDQAFATLTTGQLTFEGGNHAELTIDGPSTFHAMFEDIDQASDYVHVETYIIEDDEIGRALAEHLFKARDRGVKVRLLVDAFGSSGLSEDYVTQLEVHDIDFQKFHPIDPSEDPRIWRSNNRDHRKLLVIDDRIAYTGGLNFSEVYKEGSRSVRQKTPAEDGKWRDTQVRISGPVVKQFQDYFLKMWNRDLPDEEHVIEAQQSPVFETQGDVEIAVVASRGGDDHEFDIYSEFTKAIGESRNRVWITQAYFAPNEEFLETLKAVSARGVDVQLLLPGISDSSLIIQASRASYQELLEAGVRIYERKASVLHAKTMVIDGVWSSVGSANFDYRSFVHNYELNAVLVNRDFGRSMEALFQDDIAQSKEITIAAWNDRSVRQRFEEWLGHMLRGWL